MTIHRFDNDTEAYNASQCRDDIKDGDVLVTPNASAVLVGAWPVLLQGESEQFHALDRGWTWARLDTETPAANGASYFRSASEAVDAPYSEEA